MEACWRASSTRPCGTISPPIFENRESRPETLRNPSSLRRPRSPVMYHPSWNAASVRSSRPREPRITFGPLTSSRPSVSAARATRKCLVVHHADPRHPASGRPTYRVAEAGMEEARLAVVERVHRDHRGALGHAVTLHRPDAERILEGQRPTSPAASRRPARTSAERGRTAPGANPPHVELQEGRRGQQDRRCIAAWTSFADTGGVERAGVADRPDPRVGREPGDRVAERVEHRQDRGQPVAGQGTERLADRLHVGIDVEV